MTIATIAKTGKNRLGPFDGGVCMRRNPFQIKASFQSYESDVFFASGVFVCAISRKLQNGMAYPETGEKGSPPGAAVRAGSPGGRPSRPTATGHECGARRGARGDKDTHRAGGEPPRAMWRGGASREGGEPPRAGWGEYCGCNGGRARAGRPGGQASRPTAKPHERGAHGDGAREAKPRGGRGGWGIGGRWGV